MSDPAPTTTAVETTPASSVPETTVEATPTVETQPVTSLLSEDVKSEVTTGTTTETKSLLSEDVKDETKTEETPSTKEKEAEVADEKPIEYTDFAVPEGMQLDPELTPQFLEYAKSLKLPQESAQKFIDMGIALHAKLVPVVTAQVQEQYVKQQQEQSLQWQNEVKQNKDIGGTNLKQTLADAKNVINKYNNSKEFMAVLDKTGLSNNIEMIRFLANINKDLKQDAVISGSQVAVKSENQTFLETLYPSMTKK